MSAKSVAVSFDAQVLLMLKNVELLQQEAMGLRRFCFDVQPESCPEYVFTRT